MGEGGKKRKGGAASTQERFSIYNIYIENGEIFQYIYYIY